MTISIDRSGVVRRRVIGEVRLQRILTICESVTGINGFRLGNGRENYHRTMR